MEELGVSELKQYEAYLGLPALVGRNKRASFDQLKQKVWKRLQGWEGKLLSQAGTEVLIKSVIQAIPTYAMSCFKLPTTLCHEIEILVWKFWWEQGVTEGKCIGLDGRIYVNIRIKEEWSLRISLGSMKQCWQSFHGDSSMMIIHCSLECSRPKFSQMVPFWMLRNLPLPLILGEALSMEGM